MAGIHTLSAADILSIHEVPAADFAAADDPISPSGLRSEHLLESAIGRQLAGFHDKLKYDTPTSNAAALCYGICMNHPFHNGNKRTALVGLLCHLDKNSYTFDDAVSQDDLYSFMLRVASHGFSTKKNPSSDAEVEAIAKWIRTRVRRIETGERIVTFRELKAILAAHGFALENPKGNTIDVVTYQERNSWFGLRSAQERIRVMRIGNPGDGEVVGKRHLREIRDRCRLTEQDGVDSFTFYAKSRPADYFVRRYRRTLRQLARV